MMRRLLELLACTLTVGVLAAALVEPDGLALLGSAMGASLWFVFDSLRARRVLDWLRHGSAAAPPAAVGVWAEVVERARKSFKTLNRKSRKSEVRLQEFLAAIQASPIGVVLLDKSTAIEWSNFTAAQHLGFDTKRDLKQPIRHLVRDPAFIDYLSQGDYAASVEIDGRDATPGHPQRISINLYLYGKGRRLMLTREVTALELAEAMRRDFVANVSHEIRTPLTVVSGFIETLLTLDLPAPERRQYLELMGTQAQRMQSLVSDLLTLSRLEGSPVPGVGEWIDTQAMLMQVVSEAQALSEVLDSGPHQVLAQGGGPRFQIAGARQELHSAMSNLVNNAVRHTPAGAQVRVGWCLNSDGGAGFYVSDDGPGIDAEHLPRLTERFYRVDRSRSRETGGTGLGLAIVKHVAQRHGGQVLIESVPGQGSTFRIILPPSRVLSGD
ncbi:phosphate regulon sensor histidine kinase PhoR [Serpentinimonas barnesii]|uniref:phosphate regulon sensor histidine kinase PhoR n=1 Tax=Serpentinimonas barnesii TaxID=1458427 RepID=UPI0004961035|nr:phosphate regulon sensor histidine kinase PhoR [Serpentinimonas barnesii]